MKHGVIKILCNYTLEGDIQKHKTLNNTGPISPLLRLLVTEFLVYYDSNWKNYNSIYKII